MLGRIARTRPFLSFYLLALGIACAVVVWRYFYGVEYEQRTGQTFDYINVLMEGITAFYGGPIYANIISIGWVALHREPIYFGVFLFAGAPTIAALAVVATGSGWDGVKRLLARLRPWSAPAFRRDALITYAAISGFFLLYSLINLFAIARVSGPEEAAELAGIWGWPAYLFLFTFLLGGLIDEGGTCEELGWRGFALPVLLERMPPLSASILLGFLWWAWHFPREIPEMQHLTDWGTWAYYQGVFVVLVTAMSVVMTASYHLTGGSALPALLMHGWGNFVTKAVGTYTITNFDYRTVVWVVAAIAAVLVFGPSLGRKRFERLMSKT